MGVQTSNAVGRKPTVNPVRTITVPLGAEHLNALEAFRRREGLSNVTEAIRSALWRFLTAEGLTDTLPPAPVQAPPGRSRRGP